jgi:MFS family permease
MLAIAGMFGMFFLAVLYMQRVLGYSAVATGFAFLPVSGLIGVFSLGFSARLSLRYGAKTIVVPGLVLMTAGLALLTRVPINGSYVTDLLPSMVLLGAGAGLFFPSLTTIAMSGVEPSEAGLASGLLNQSLQVGGSIGLAVLATLSATHSDSLVAQGQSARAALTSGYTLAFVIAAVLAGVAAAVAASVLRHDEPFAEPAYSSAG